MTDRFLTHRSRSRASLALTPPDPGRYLAIDDGTEVVLVALRPGMTRIGRSGSADIAFDDGSVSRRHAVVVIRSDGRAEVSDDGSLNGTYVNGDRITRRILVEGDEIVIGRRALRYTTVSRAPRAEATEEIAVSLR
ncbi:MAG: hypothetical protein QOF76_347 [Solirubrobacteraceae bacterium]|jgi:pSer/pThr/pTyr-binding forkhead associated (FHA) protein|nr:hypothetical protein [Solirubrobacteraceae bacterium]